MYLSLLNKEEKFYFIDLSMKVVKIDGEMTDNEKQILTKMKFEMGEDGLKYRKGVLPLEKLISYFAEKSSTVKNLVYLNLLSLSLLDEFYSVEEHFLLRNIQEQFKISDKKRAEIIKVVYADRDLKEKARRVISE